MNRVSKMIDKQNYSYRITIEWRKNGNGDLPGPVPNLGCPPGHVPTKTSLVEYNASKKWLKYCQPPSYQTLRLFSQDRIKISPNLQSSMPIKLILDIALRFLNIPRLTAGKNL